MCTKTLFRVKRFLPSAGLYYPGLAKQDGLNDRATGAQAHMTAWARGYKTSLMLNSAEHEIFPANQCGNTIVGISIFISRKNSIICLSEPKKC